MSRASETAFYVCNQPITAERAGEAIRAHWRVETTSHYSRDVTFGEDGSRIQYNPGVFAALCSCRHHDGLYCNTEPYYYGCL